MNIQEFIPRRIRRDLYVPAEEAIHKAMEEIEKMPADELLTKAIVSLQEAKEFVADFIDKRNANINLPKN